MSRALVLLVFAMGFTASAAAAGPAVPDASVAASPKRPNIVLLIGDDHGWPYYGFMESPKVFKTRDGTVSAQSIAPTPNLDALATAGIVFTHGYSTVSVCVPALRTLLSAAEWHPVQWNQRIDRIGEERSLGERGQASISRFIRTLPRELGRYGYLTWRGGEMWEGSISDAGFTHGNKGRLKQAQWFGRKGWSTASCGSTGDPAIPCAARFDRPPSRWGHGSRDAVALCPPSRR